ncbi:uncharacterized protein LOC132705246 [Cylas formicarius]|uniref:uncharacterized protein LOC132705246 n=1 Tax=Cylas formicarius TaxID=197179 RepID=UPI0029584D38|nr:uncharacterized protein LOC132705246 [Cylas formicarius]
MNVLKLLLSTDPLAVDDPLWFIERLWSLAVNNTVWLVIGTLTLVCSISEVCGVLGYMAYKPNFQTAINFAPMFFTSYHTTLCLTPILLQRNAFQTARKYANEKFWKISTASSEALREISVDIIIAKVAWVTNFILNSCSPFFYIPYNGVDFDNTLHPMIAILPQLRLPLTVNYMIVFFNHILVFWKVYYIVLYMLNLTYLVVQYKLQVTILKWKIVNITEGLGKNVELGSMRDDANCQREIHERLKVYVQHYWYLKVYGQMVTESLKISLLFHVFSGIALMTSLLYLSLLRDESADTAAFILELVSALYIAFFYVFWAEAFCDQTNVLYDAISLSHWNCFDRSNSVTILILYDNLKRKLFLTGGGIFIMSFRLLVWIVEKVVNLLSVLKLLES